MLRIATEDDAEKLLNIYGYYVENTAITFEYEVPSVEEFQGRIRRILREYPYLVAEEDHKLVGYAYASRFHERKACDWAVETAIYVDKDVRKQGIGKKLYEALEKALALQNVISLNACIANLLVEDEYLTKTAYNTMNILAIGSQVNFINADINLADGIIWCGWKSLLESIQIIRCECNKFCVN